MHRRPGRVIHDIRAQHQHSLQMWRVRYEDYKPSPLGTPFNPSCLYLSTLSSHTTSDAQNAFIRKSVRLLIPPRVRFLELRATEYFSRTRSEIFGMELEMVKPSDQGKARTIIDDMKAKFAFVVNVISGRCARMGPSLKGRNHRTRISSSLRFWGGARRRIRVFGRNIWVLERELRLESCGRVVCLGWLEGGGG
ncbi:uncharacterized protein BDV14DRAFT_141699 [Aspergillus stella-maris]|uniref:uncharacterized protein n=1 Tax=Aspergillus stella-maris TaxID=1810926 RepID=UPI003CCC93C8